MKKLFSTKVIIVAVVVAIILALSLATCIDDKQSEIFVKSVTMNSSSKDLYVGDTFQLEAMVSPADATNQTLAWLSSNESVTVDSLGKITAVNEGTATITVTAKDGSGAKAMCEVTVKVKAKDGECESEGDLKREAKGEDNIIKVSTVTMNFTTKDLYVGDTFQLEATVSPTDATNQTLIWSSSNDNVTVDQSGRIKAEKEGTAIITATAKGGSRAKATCEFNVQAKVIKVESVTMNLTAKDLSVGDSFNLEATVSPTDATNKTLIWSSSNDNVTVDQSGRIKAEKEGTAIITATAEGGSGAKATCEFNVQAKVIKVESVTMNLTAKDLSVGDSFNLEATVSPTDATNQTLVWSSSNDNVTVDQSGRIKAEKEGTAIITATAEGGSGAKATCKVTVKKRTNYKSTYTKDDYYLWDAYESCDKPDTKKWEENSLYYNDNAGKDVIASQSCKDCITEDQMKMYLGAGVYWDEEGKEYIIEGKTYKVGLWVKRSSKIDGFNDGSATKRVNLELNDGSNLFKKGKPDNISDYFFLPAAGYYSDSCLYSVGAYGNYWFSTSNGNDAYGFYFYRDVASVVNYNRNYGRLRLFAE